MCAIEFRADRKSNMAARPQSWIFFRAHYLENRLWNQLEIFIIDWYPWEDVRYWILGRLEIQYGRQATILNFLSRALSWEPFMESTWNLYHWLVPIRGCALSNFGPIGNPIWPLGHHLEFSTRGFTLHYKTHMCTRALRCFTFTLHYKTHMCTQALRNCSLL